MLNRLTSHRTAQHRVISCVSSVAASASASSSLTSAIAPVAATAAVAHSLPSSSSSSSSFLTRRTFTTSTPLCGRPHHRIPLAPGLPYKIRYVSPPTFNTLLKKFILQVHPDIFNDSPEHASVNQNSLQQLNAFISSMKSKASGSTYPVAQKLELVFYLKKRHGDQEYYAHSILEGKHLLDRFSRRVMKDQQRAIPKRRGELLIERYEKKKAQEKALAEGGEQALAELVPPPPTRGSVISGEFHILPVKLRTNGLRCKTSLMKQFRSIFMRAGIEGSAGEFVWDTEYWKLGPPEEEVSEEVKKAQAAAEKE